MRACCFPEFCKFLRKSIKRLTLLLCVDSFPSQYYGRVTCAMQVLPTLGPSTVWNASVGTVNQLWHRSSRIPSAACPVQVCKTNILFPSVPDPPDPHVFGPPGSGSISQRYGSKSFYQQAKIERKTLIPTVL